MTTNGRLGLALCCLALSCQRSPTGRSLAPAGKTAATVGIGSSGTPADSAIRSLPVEDSGAPLKVSKFLGRSCALDEAGLAYCWAPAMSLVTERAGDAVPRRTPELDGARAFTKSTYFSYFANDVGQIFAWSKDRHSYLGDISRPKRLPGVDNVVQLEATGDVVYALQSDGTLKAWNDSFSSSEAGEPGSVVSNPPELGARDAQGLAPKFNFHFLARDGAVHRSLPPAPTAVAGVTGARSVTDCGSLACMLNDAKRARCWRRNNQLPPFDLVGTFAGLGCAAGGDVYALLDNGSVMVATDSFEPSKLTRIPTLADVAELALCDGSLSCPHCVKLRSGLVSCWGESPERKLGTGAWPNDPQLMPLQKGRDVTTPRTP
jgi:hypothetical protein